MNINQVLIVAMFFCVVYLLVAANGEEAWGGAPSTHTVRNYCRKLAGKPHPERVPEGLLPGPSGYTLPGCWTGRITSLEGLDKVGQGLSEGALKHIGNSLISMHAHTDFIKGFQFGKSVFMSGCLRLHEVEMGFVLSRRSR